MGGIEVEMQEKECCETKEAGTAPVTKDDVMRAFYSLSRADQEAVRAVLAGGSSGTQSCCSASMKEHIREVMSSIEESDDPMAGCREMMAKCQEMMQRMVTS